MAAKCHTAHMGQRNGWGGPVVGFSSKSAAFFLALSSLTTQHGEARGCGV